MRQITASGTAGAAYADVAPTANANEGIAEISIKNDGATGSTLYAAAGAAPSADTGAVRLSGGESATFRYDPRGPCALNVKGDGIDYSIAALAESL